MTGIHTVTVLEAGVSARSAGDWKAIVGWPLIDAMSVEYSTPPIEDRAVAVQSLLAQQCQHRAASIPIC